MSIAKPGWVSNTGFEGAAASITGSDRGGKLESVKQHHMNERIVRGMFASALVQHPKTCRSWCPSRETPRNTSLSVCVCVGVSVSVGVNVSVSVCVRVCAGMCGVYTLIVS